MPYDGPATREIIPTKKPRKRRPRTVKGPTGYVVHEGPGLLNGAGIVVIATMDSSNTKTPGMVSVWIMRAGVDPFEAWRAGTDAAVCGDCVHRGTLAGAELLTMDFAATAEDRSCYVQFRAMLSIYKKHQAGGYPRLALGQLAETFAGTKIRFGAYGDPAAVDVRVWVAMASRCKLWTGYTHQWREGFAGLAELFMASCETEQDRIDARALGFRLYSVTEDEAELLPGHVFCPGSEAGGYRLTCDRCGWCNGTAGRGPDVQSWVHGSDDKLIKLTRNLRRRAA